MALPDSNRQQATLSSAAVLTRQVVAIVQSVAIDHVDDLQVGLIDDQKVLLEQCIVIEFQCSHLTSEIGRHRLVIGTVVPMAGVKFAGWFSVVPLRPISFNASRCCARVSARVLV